MSRSRSRVVDGLRSGVRRAEKSILTLLVTGMVGLALLQVILRNVFKTGWPWAEPLLGMGLLWLTMLGALAASGGSRRHISMDALSHALPARARGWLARANALFAAAVCAGLTVAAWRFVALQREWPGEGLLGLPQWAFYLVLPAGFALMALRFAFRILAPAHWLPAPAGMEEAP